MKKHTLFGWLIASGLFLTALSPVAAQGQVAVALNTPTTLTGDINLGMTNLEIPFDVSGAMGLALDVVVPVDGARFSLRNPAGLLVVTPGDPRVQFLPGRDLRSLNPPPGGIFALEEISLPSPGRWSILLDFPMAPHRTVAVATVFLNTRYHAGIVMERESLVTGEDVSIGMLVLDGGVPISGLTPAITITPSNPAGAPTTLAAFDDGVNPDGLANDGIYSVDFTFPAPGTYRITGAVTIPTGQGNVIRTASHTVTVRNRALTLTGVALETLRGPGNCVAGIRPHFNVTVNRAGDFLFRGTLRASNGRQILASARRTLGLGNQTVNVVFPVAEIKTGLAVDGPYQLHEQDIFYLDTDGTWVLTQKHREAFSTPPLLLSQFCAPPIELTQSLTVTPILRDGFIDALRLTFPIRVANAGTFSISLKIVDNQGGDVGLFAGNRLLSVGQNDVSFTIPGLNFLNGDGPYRVISLIVLGPGGSAQLAELGRTGALQRWQFFPRLNGDLNNDGFVDAVDHPFINAALNQPALVPGDRRDLNRDGVINAADLAVLVTLCTRTPCAPVAPPVTTAQLTPEPNAEGWNNSDVLVRLAATSPAGIAIRQINFSATGAQPIANTSVAGALAQITIRNEGTTTLFYFATDVLSNVETTKNKTLKLDKTPPAVTYTGNAGTYTVDQRVIINCSASDSLSGLVSSTCQSANAPAYTFNLGQNTLQATAVDRAGNQGSGATSFSVLVTYDSLCNLTRQFVSHPGIANSLCAKLNAAAAAAARGDLHARDGQLGAYRNELAAQRGRALTAEHADILTPLSHALQR